jgi:hypothetical protein
MAILADVAPYSREYNTYRLKVGAAARDNTELQIEYEKILDRVRQTRSFRPAAQQNPRARAGRSFQFAGTVNFLVVEPGLITWMIQPWKQARLLGAIVLRHFVSQT